MSYMDTKFCEVCDEDYDWAAPECPGCVHRRHSEAQQAEIDRLRAEVKQLRAELRAALHPAD